MKSTIGWRWMARESKADMATIIGEIWGSFNTSKNKPEVWQDPEQRAKRGRLQSNFGLILDNKIGRWKFPFCYVRVIPKAEVHLPCRLSVHSVNTWKNLRQLTTAKLFTLMKKNSSTCQNSEKTWIAVLWQMLTCQAFWRPHLAGKNQTT